MEIKIVSDGRHWKNINAMRAKNIKIFNFVIEVGFAFSSTNVRKRVDLKLFIPK